jgi:hypothetical protein
MTTLPLIRDTTPGIYQVCTTANTDYAIAIPDTALGCVLWFETSATDSTMISGRIGIDQDSTLVTGLTGADTVLGYFPPMPVEYQFLGYSDGTETHTYRDYYLHVASGTAGAVVRGMWLYRTDTV